MVELSHYPTAIAEGGALPIAQAAQRVNEIDSQLMAVQQQIDRFEGNADRAAAFDLDLKNDGQRKARSFEVLLVNQEYQQAMDTQMRLAAEKANAIAEGGALPIAQLEYLRNQFSVAKLSARLAIAQQLTDFESRELVGL